MQALNYYPISLDEIEAKVAKKFKRNGTQKLEDNEPLDNVKEIVNEFGEKIIRVDGEIPVDLPINNEDRFLFISYDQSSLTHGLHKYPAKFFPELPRWLIKRYSKEGDLIIDPFSGSATTNIEALLAKRHSVGIDVSPFSKFIAKVKVTPLDEAELETCKKRLLRLLVNYRPEKVSADDIPSFPYRDNWFIREIILELAYIKKCIENLDTNEDVKDFLKVCFSSIIRSVSNADDNCTRTVIRKKLNKVVNPSDALRKFAEAVLTNIPKMIDFSRSCPSNISVTFPENMDARNIKYEKETFDLALTSPPYANAVDYPRTHQLETYWLGFAQGSLTPLKKKQVGTESVSAKDYKELHLIGVKEADEVITKIYNKDPRRAYIAYKYLKDMQKNLEEVYKVLKFNSRYIIVVGNNRIRGEVFENWKYIIALAEKVGFKLENYFASEIIKHFIKVPREERIDTDWILVLTKRG
ncbi:MAG: DNA methyltransferase [Dethiobacteria bacterium]|jgi:DNA modification methylase